MPRPCNRVIFRFSLRCRRDDHAPSAATADRHQARAHARTPVGAADRRSASKLSRAWTPAMTGAPLQVDRIDDISIPISEARLPARLYAPDRRRAYPLLVYFHGGGYVKG